MQKPYEVTRLDILSRKAYPLTELIRLSKKDGVLTVDIKQNQKGRGIYIHKDSKTVEIVFKKGLLRRYSKDIQDSLFEEMKKAC